jgi:hypothetical protein
VVDTGVLDRRARAGEERLADVLHRVEVVEFLHPLLQIDIDVVDLRLLLRTGEGVVAEDVEALLRQLADLVLSLLDGGHA